MSALVISSRSLGGSIGLAICKSRSRTVDSCLWNLPGTAIFSTRLSSQLPAQIASRTLPLGLAPQSLDQLIGALSAHNIPAVMAIPGITPAIIGAATEGLKTAFIAAAKFIWVFGLGESGRGSCDAAADQPKAVCVVAAVLCVFIQNLSEEYTLAIDHPVEAKSEQKQEYA